jgi:hypothetical protein
MGPLHRRDSWTAGLVRRMSSSSSSSSSTSEDDEELVAADLRARSLLQSGSVFRAFRALGHASWELRNVTLVALSVEDAVRLRVGGLLAARELAESERYRGAALFVSASADAQLGDSGALGVNREQILCGVSSTVLTQKNIFYAATYGECCY